MSDEMNTNDASGQVDQTSQDDVNVGKVPEFNEELLKPLIEKHTKGLMDKLEMTIKEKSGLDRKVSELSKQLKDKEKEKLTAEQLLELEKKEFFGERQKFYRAQAVVKYGLANEEDGINLGDYVQGESEEDVFKNAESLKKQLDIIIKKGIEKGVEDRLKQGYTPKASTVNGQTFDLSNISSEELGKKATEIAKMPASPEKTKLLNDLFKEQNKRLRR